jgi:hypothetical protein
VLTTAQRKNVSCYESFTKGASEPLGRPRRRYKSTHFLNYKEVPSFSRVCFLGRKRSLAGLHGRSGHWRKPNICHAVAAWVTQWVRGSNAARSERFFCSQKRPDPLWAHPDSCGMGTGGLSTGVMRPGSEADKSPAPSNEDKDGWSLKLHLCSPHMSS